MTLISKKIFRKLLLLLPYLVILASTSSAFAFGLWTNASGIFGSPTRVAVTTYFLQRDEHQLGGHYYDQNGILQFSPTGFHHGIDIAGGGRVDKSRVIISDTEPVRAALDGEVVFTGFKNDGYGHQVVIYNGFNINGNGQHTYTFYSHVGTVDGTSFITISAGQIVPAGWQIGGQGNSGFTFGRTGIHLDFEIRLSPTLITDWAATDRNALLAASPNFYLKKNLTFTDEKKVKRIKAGPWPQIPSENVIDWPMFKHDAEHSASASIVLFPPLTEKWATLINPDEFRSSPSVFNNKVYIGAPDGNLVAIDAASGNILWKFLTGGKIRTTAAVADNMVFIASDDGNLYALDAENGGLKWKLTSNVGTPLSPIIFGGDVYICLDKMYALNAINGAVVWSKQINCGISGFAVGNGILYSGVHPDKVFALDADTGHRIWTFAILAGSIRDLAFSDNTVYFTADCLIKTGICPQTNILYALDGKTAEEKWNFRADETFHPVAISVNSIYLSSTVGPFPSVGKLYKLNAANGQKLWEIVFPNVSGMPLVSGETIYLEIAGGSSPPNEGKIMAISAVDGAITEEIIAGSISQFKYTGIPNCCALSLGNNLLYTLTSEGVLKAFGN